MTSASFEWPFSHLASGLYHPPMDSLVSPRAARLASGLPHIDTLRDPARLQRLRRLVKAAEGSAVLGALVDLAARITGTAAAQLSLLADQEVAISIRSVGAPVVPRTLDLQDSLCSITALSGDVLVAAEARRHPWLADLLPVSGGAIGAYLGAPLALPDGTMLGALCVWEPAERSWSERDVGLTCAVADVVALELQRLAGTS